MTISRGQVLLASGIAKLDDKTISGAATRATASARPSFLDEAFRATHYRYDITFNDDDSWTYLLQKLVVKGAQHPFNHHDTNMLKRVAAPAILNERAKGA